MEKSNVSENKDIETAITRRSLVKSLGVGAAVLTVESGTTTATSDGYGNGGYGEGEYGGSSSTLTVTTDGTSAVGETSATLEGAVTDLGGASSVDVYFEYRNAGETTWSATPVQTLSSTGGVTASVSGLRDGVDYEFKPVASTSDGYSDTGSIAGFTTVDHPVSVATDGATGVDETSATLNGSLTDLGNADSVDVSFEYRRAGSSTWNATSTQSLTSTGDFSKTVTGLTSDTDYEFRAAVLASDDDTDTGSPVAFATATAEEEPAIDGFDVSEAGSPNPHAEISVDWVVSDADGDLSAVSVWIDDTSGTTVKSSKTSIGGSSASGADSFKIKHGDGEVYDVTLRVADDASNAVNKTQSV